jgi:hypothetical protein
MQKIGFIDYFLDEWHANNYPRMIAEASGGDMAVAYAYGMIDSPLGGLTTEQWCARMGTRQCGTIDEIVEKSDVLIVLSPDNCEMHEALCQKPLSSGKRTYVDKTFAPDGATARRIFAVAERHGTPCYSTSALRFAAEYRDIDPAKVRAVNAWGPYGFETYAIHQLEPIMMLTKGSPKRVLATKGEKYSQMLIEFEDGRYATLSNYEEGSPFMMNVCMEGGQPRRQRGVGFLHGIHPRNGEIFPQRRRQCAARGDRRHHGCARRGDQGACAARRMDRGGKIKGSLSIKKGTAIFRGRSSFFAQTSLSGLLTVIPCIP